MKIDFSKLVVLLLPQTLRQTKLAYFIEACAEPFKVLYNSLVSYNATKRLEIATNYQTCYLEAYLNYILLGSFDRQITITDGDGITVDFYIVIPTTVSVNIYRVEAIVDKYKLIGKRYSVIGGSVTYASTWQTFLAEIVSVTNVGVWQTFLPEIITTTKDIDVNLTATPYKESGTLIMEVYLQDNTLAESTLTVVIAYTYAIQTDRTEQGHIKYLQKKDTLFIYADSSASQETIEASYGGGTIVDNSWKIVSITPESDAYYNYINTD